MKDFIRQELVELAIDIRTFYESDPDRSAGCCVHLVTDDFNLEDHHVEFCLNQAVELGHSECEALARRLLALTEDDRGVACELSWQVEARA